MFQRGLGAVIILIALISCGPKQLPEIEIHAAGKLYFTMDCVWRNWGNGQALWWCSANAITDLIDGYVFLELLENEILSFCGEDLILNSGYDLHDNWVAALTSGRFNCINTPENNLGNEFDWIWYQEEHTLELIWRPDETQTKILTLIIDEGPPVSTVNGTVYYREIN